MNPKETQGAGNVIEKFIEMVENFLRRIIKEEIRAAFSNRDEIASKDWLKAKDLEKIYGLPRGWFEDRGRAGDIARAKPGRYVVFKRHDVEAYLERHRKAQQKKRARLRLASPASQKK